MRADCVTTPETTSSAGAGELVGTHETEAIFEVRVTVSPDLSEIGVPVPTVSHPAEDGLFLVEIGNSPRIVVVAVLEDFGASAGFRGRRLSDDLSRHLWGVLSRRSFESTAGNRGISAFLMPFRGTGRRKNGT